MAKTGSISTVAVVVTVLNEADTIKLLLESLLKQTLTPSEIVIVDGGSTDGTWKTLSLQAHKPPRLRVFQLPKSSRSQGRNFGVSKTHSRIIAFTDAGCIPHRDWLKELIRPFAKHQVNVVSGYYAGLAKNDFQKCLIPYVLVMPDKASRTEFFPSTRSMALTRAVWNQTGGFDPRLNFGEDFAFAHWLKQIGFSFYFAPKAVVEWIPRPNLWAAAKMFFYFSLGDVQARIFRPKVKLLFIRYLVFTYIFLLALENHFFFYLIIPAIFLYLIWSVAKNYHYVNKLAAVFWLPVIQITADLSVMWGTLIGLMSRAYGLF